MQGFSVTGVAGDVVVGSCPVIPSAIAINDTDFKLIATKENNARVLVGGRCSHVKAGIQVFIGADLVGSTECVVVGSDYKWQILIDASNFSDGDLALKAKLVLVGSSSAEDQKVLKKDTLPPNSVLTSLPANPSLDSAINVGVGGVEVDSYKYSLGTTADCAMRTYSDWVPASQKIIESLGADASYVLCVIGRDIYGNYQSNATSYNWLKRTIFKVAVKAENIFHSKIAITLTVGGDPYNFELAKDSLTYQTSKEYAPGTPTSLVVVTSLTEPALPCNTAQSTSAVGPTDLLLTVTCPAIEGISIFAQSSSIASGTKRQLYATGSFAGGLFADITDIATWTSSSTERASVVKGLVLGLQSGSVDIKAAFGGREETFSVTVFLKTLSSLIVTPSVASIPVGTTSVFKAIATWSDGQVQDLTSSSSWSSVTESVATVNNTALKGLVTTHAAGNAEIRATFGNVTTSSNVTVTNVTLTSIEISPAILSGAIGLKQQFTATGIYSDGTTQNLTNQVTWNIPATEIATVDSSGKVQLLKAGSTTVTATSGVRSASRQINVSSATLNSISIAPSTLTIAAGYSRQLAGTAHYSDSTVKDVTQQVQWSVSNSSFASVGNAAGYQGMLQALAVGTINVTAALDGVTASLPVNITSAVLTSIAVSPKTFLVSRSSSLQYSAVGTFSDSSTINLTDQVFWSTNHLNTSISNSTGSRGLFANAFTGTTYPSFDVTATLSGVTGTATGVLTAGALQSIKINPVTAKTPRNRTIEFKSYGIYNDGATFDLTTYSIFSVSSPAIGIVSNSAQDKGLFTPIAEGMTDVSATFSGFSATSSIEVDDEFVASASNQGIGLTARYYNFDWINPGGTFITQLASIDEARFKGTRIDNTVNFNWLSGKAPLGIDSDFAARWTGRIYFPIGGVTYQLRTTSDDGVRLWIDNTLVINQWSDHQVTQHFYNLVVAEPGYKTVKIDFYEHGGDAVMKLEWLYPPSVSYVPVPTTYLFPE